MNTNLVSLVNGKYYCLFCLKELSSNEDCTCKGAKKAMLVAQQKASSAKFINRNKDIPTFKHSKGNK